MSERYHMIRVLGEGSFGKCYLVEAESSNAICVIKQIDIRVMSPTEKEETIREALILRSLEHPNIIQFKDAYTTKKGKLCIVMDYADGGDLQSRTRQQNGKLFEEKLILDWFVQICLGLKHIHDRKILHRDLKSQNIFLTKKGRVKLGDFGIAKVLNKTTDNARTMVGTPYYLSPEIIENKPYNFKSDIWSMGVILYEMCCLKPPFDASSLHFLALKIVRGSYPAVPSKYSRELRLLLSKMLSTDPNKRPSIHQVLKEPLITSRIQNFLTKSLRNEEFSHTVIHNFDIFLPPKPTKKGKTQLEAPGPEPVSKRPLSPGPPKVAWTEESKSPRAAERQRIRADIQKTRKSLKGQNAELQFAGSPQEVADFKEAQAQIIEMEEAILECTGEVLQPDCEAVELPEELPSDQEQELPDDDPPEFESLPEVRAGDYDKTAALRRYIADNIGNAVFSEVYVIVKELESSLVDEEIGYEYYYTHVQHLMSIDLLYEYLPLIQTLIEMEE